AKLDFAADSLICSSNVEIADRQIDSPVGSPAARIRAGRTAEDQGAHQAEYERESVSTRAQSNGGGEGGAGRAGAPVSKSHSGTFAGKIGEISPLPAGKYFDRQRFGRSARAGHPRFCGTGRGRRKAVPFVGAIFQPQLLVVSSVGGYPRRRA